MRLLRITILMAIVCPQRIAFAPPQPPKILGIALVRFTVTSIEASQPFYAKTLALPEGAQGCFSPMGVAVCFHISSAQEVEVVQGDASKGKNLETLGFQVSDASAMRKYLLSHGVKCGKVAKSNNGHDFIEVQDPENHRILFISSGGVISDPWPLSPTHSNHLIHAGFVVHDRAAEDHFFKDILGFRLYWHGGPEEGKDRWVAMQVPDGTDWVEYMLGIPPDASHHTLGVMNHISLGVEDIHATEKQLIANGWKLGEAPKIGRDGKWQLNVYDPDDTRVEFMEFKPTQEPCCNPFTGPHPGPPTSSAPLPQPNQ